MVKKFLFLLAPLPFLLSFHVWLLSLTPSSFLSFSEAFFSFLPFSGLRVFFTARHTA